jgi:serine/threonine protein kinase
MNYIHCIKIIDQCADGLDYLHSFGFVHKDIKPENIIVRFDKDEPYARIIDLGQAFDNYPISGTLFYQSPEQVAQINQSSDSIKSGPSSDVFSLGLVFFEILTGVHPYTNVNMGLHRSLVSQSMAFNYFNMNVDYNRIQMPSLAQLIKEVLDKDPRNRPPLSKVRAECKRIISYLTKG